ncbi:MAG: L,D-transpeptidase family protein [Mizugakiibacter sp.]|uniref:L,D-transpeptidase family protein n=1 Tax=Mizugakiibacter sp. TaxID=1972610 RepID=UPI0031CB1592|nr:L,D-transpeptidase family protein [Xanthomonadaceae bacterium]
MRRIGRLVLAVVVVGLLGAAGRGAAQSPPPADAVAERLRERIEQLHEADVRAPAVGGARLVEGVAAFYQQRGFAPAWEAPGRRAALVAALRGLANDGLDPRDYGVDALARPPEPNASLLEDATRRADADLRATAACFAALQHLYRGKVDPRSLDPGWNLEPRDADVAQGLRDASVAIGEGRIAEAFAQARPQHPLYGRLRDALRRLRETEARGGWPSVPAGPTLREGMVDPRVALLRRRLTADEVAGETLAAPQDADVFDATLAAAVRRFQTEQLLDADGAVGPATRAALDVPVHARIDQVRVNMERARWLLHQIRGDFVLVDIAGYRITYFKGAQPEWRSRVVVGRPYRRTPAFKSEITYVTFNPTWTVPPTILHNDILPKLRRKPGYLAANRIRVLDAGGREVPPGRVDWKHPQGLTLRQDAGPGNSLGRVVIRFPNPYAVYLHDTPHTELFGAGQRAFSSGCIRVERPLELVERLLDDPANWNRAAIDAAIATGATRTVNLARPVPLLLLYWTVDVLPDGRVAYKPDVYARDAELLHALDAHLPATMPR